MSEKSISIQKGERNTFDVESYKARMTAYAEGIRKYKLKTSVEKKAEKKQTESEVRCHERF